MYPAIPVVPDKMKQAAESVRKGTKQVNCFHTANWV